MGMLDELGHDRRHVERCRQQVIGERRVAHEPLAELDLLHDRESQPLRDATLDLADDGDGVDRLAHILGGRDLDDLHESSVHVDVDDRAVRREEERDVSLILRLGVARLRVPMAVRDGPIDRLVQQRSQIIRGTAGFPRARE